VAAAEGREGAGVATGEPALAGFFAATQRRAFSLAFRITGDAKLAEDAAESAFAALKAPYAESQLFDAVRQAALAVAPKRSDSGRQSYVIAAAVRATFESLGQLERSALELAHSGGMGVAAIAEALDEEPATVRQALRDALLRLGALAREEGNRP
jgi:DNA-directed RNA polymerase specialized sigma24 family protein